MLSKCFVMKAILCINLFMFLKGYVYATNSLFYYRINCGHFTRLVVAYLTDSVIYSFLHSMACSMECLILVEIL